MADTELLRLMPAVEQGDVAAMQRVAAIVQAASSAALSELDTLVSFEKTYAIPRQERVVAQHQRELVAMWQQELADQPNSLANARARLARVMK